MPSFARASAISLPSIPSCPRIQVKLTDLHVEASRSSDLLVLMQSALDEESEDSACTDDKESVKMATDVS